LVVFGLSSGMATIRDKLGHWPSVPLRHGKEDQFAFSLIMRTRLPPLGEAILPSGSVERPDFSGHPDIPPPGATIAMKAKSVRDCRPTANARSRDRMTSGRPCGTGADSRETLSRPASRQRWPSLSRIVAIPQGDDRVQAGSGWTDDPRRPGGGPGDDPGRVGDDQVAARSPPGYSIDRHLGLG
jgi:hypothetical protein